MKEGRREGGKEGRREGGKEDVPGDVAGAEGEEVLVGVNLVVVHLLRGGREEGKEGGKEGEVRSTFLAFNFKGGREGWKEGGVARSEYFLSTLYASMNASNDKGTA